LDSSIDKDLGLDSLSRAELVGRLEQCFEVSLPERTFASAESPRDLLTAVISAHPSTIGFRRAQPVAIAPTAAKAVPWEARTWIEVMAWHAAVHPERPHLKFYDDRDQGEQLTYRELYSEACRLAAGLMSQAVDPGSTVAIMLPTGKHYFFSFCGILLSGCIPVPLYPPPRAARIQEHLSRNVGILRNAGVEALITAAEILPVARLLAASVESLRVITTPENLAGTADPHFMVAEVDEDDLALIQYTSGSTGEAKGAALTHGNLLANVRAMATVLEAKPEDVFVSWLPLYHDMGLIGAWLGSLHHGVPLVIMSPLTFLARPVRWLRAISTYGGTLSGGPNFAYELCVRRIDAKEVEGLDLSSWRVAFNGAEPVNPDTLDRFFERFKAQGFRREAMLPVYGLAENCVGLCFPQIARGPRIETISRRLLQTTEEAVPVATDDPSALRLASCGSPLPGHEIRVVDFSDRELPERKQGRLQFRGPSATKGYYRNPQATRLLFDGDWLNTGDLGYLAGGDVFVTGRSKDLVIRAGRNIHPAELESVIGTIPGLRADHVAAFGAPNAQSGTERLVIVAETRKHSSADAEALRARINELTTDLIGAPADEVILAPPNAIPRTPSGKIRRSACRELWSEGRLGVTAPPRWLTQLRLLKTVALPVARRALGSLRANLFAFYAWSLVVIMAPFIWTAVVVSPDVAWSWRATRLGARLLARLTGTSLAVRGLDNIPAPGEACVMTANHASYVDVLALVAALPRPVSFVAKAELSRSFFTRLPLTRLGTLFVERFDPQKGLEDYRQLARASRREFPLLFFPEGTFRRMPGLLPFHMGAFAAAAAANLPIVPVVLRGTRSILRSGSWFPRPGRITLTICPPIRPEASGHRWRIALKLRDTVRQAMLQHCGEPDLQNEPY
jgi:1-acyl-sn-glycerol-3-phosphate acyltransferase